jgi:glycosyltransferase involved in cell wall biosynthesis
MANKRWRKFPFWLSLQRPALERVHCFHATGEQEAGYIRQLGFRQPIAIIANGVDLPPSASVERRNEVLFLGRIAREKGLDLLLPAWQHIAARFPGWRLRIVGPLDGAHAAEMRALAARLGVRECEFAGELRGERKAEAFARARLFVLPSYSENFGMVVAEALAHGVPAITTTRTPWSELAERGSGWCIEPTPDALTNALSVALSLPPGSLETMGGRGRAWIRSDYAWETLARCMVETYMWLQNGATGSRPGHVLVD